MVRSRSDRNETSIQKLSLFLPVGFRDMREHTGSRRCFIYSYTDHLYLELSINNRQGD